MAERSREEVQEFVVGAIDRWYSSDVLEERVGIEVQLANLQNDIVAGKMLYKEQAKLLEELMNIELKDRLIGYSHYNGNLMLVVDDLSIYADAWALYCRPGTYMTVL